MLHGFIATLEEKVQRGTRPCLFQPYRGLFDWFHKEIVVPRTASWVFWTAPVVTCAALHTAPILIPLLTDYPPPLSDIRDILGGGLTLIVGGFAILLSGLDSGHP